ncbi:MAG: ABC transporter ATP-binding protein [Myxococcales bacterium]|nr:ABC transporter ATP-binding protein [Myxococcales bacterium]USN50526.1 MAG: ABC transporter ATP-binding protein [Myxococcales bacterium]
MNVEIKNLSKNYYLNGITIPVLKNINVSIAQGDLISLTGPSGAGKSTFLHVVGTLDTPTLGTITYDFANIMHWSEAKIADFRNENIGYVFQFHHLMSEFSAVENVMMPLMMRRVSKNKAYPKACEVLEYVGLGDRLSHKPGELSGGEQQRVALARALAHEPRLLLADEPTGNLDDKTGHHIIELIKKYNEEKKVTVLLVTHNKAISDSFHRKFFLDKENLYVA